MDAGGSATAFVIEGSIHLDNRNDGGCFLGMCNSPQSHGIQPTYTWTKFSWLVASAIIL